MKVYKAIWLCILLIAPEFTNSFPSAQNSEDVLKTRNRKRTVKTTRRTKPTTTTMPSTTTTPATTTPTTPLETTIMTLPPTTRRTNPTCPPGETSLTKDDLLFLIQNGAKHSVEAYNKIAEVLSEEAEQVYDKHMKDLKAIIQKAADEPHHLEHVIQYVVDKREKLQPMIANLDKTFQTHTQIFDDFGKLEDDAQILLMRFSICENLCETCVNKLRSKPSETKTIEVLKNSVKFQPDTEEIYCGKLPNIKHKIASSIAMSLNKAEIEGQKLIKYYNEKIGHDILSFKDALTELAFSKFGRTFYYFMKLMDEYIHLKTDVDEISSSIKQNIRDLRRNITDFQIHMEKTSDEIQRIQMKCVACSSHLRKMEKLRTTAMSEEEVYSSTSDEDEDDDLGPPTSPSTSDEDNDDDSEPPTSSSTSDEDEDILPPTPTDILENLLEELNANLNQTIFLSLTSKFEKIFSILEVGPPKYVDVMTPLQDKVEEIIQNEKEMFEKLKQYFPVKQIADIKAMPNTINKLKKEVDEIDEKLKSMDYYYRLDIIKSI